MNFYCFGWRSGYFSIILKHENKYSYDELHELLENVKYDYKDISELEKLGFEKVECVFFDTNGF